MVPVPVSPLGLQWGQQDRPLPVPRPSLKVEGVGDVPRNQDLYGVCGPRRQGRALWRLLIGRPEEEDGNAYV